MKKFVVAGIAAGALIAPSAASANYNISQRHAEVLAVQASDARYANRFGTEADNAACRPQGSSYDSSSYLKRWQGYYHRWVCVWHGTDSDGAEVWGTFLIAGNSGARFTYMPLYGGLHWM